MFAMAAFSIEDGGSCGGGAQSARRGEHRIAQALHARRFGRAIHVENDNFVVALAQPRRWQEQALLRTYAPIASEVVAVHPHMSLAEGARVQEGAARRAGAEMT